MRYAAPTTTKQAVALFVGTQGRRTVAVEKVVAGPGRTTLKKGVIEAARVALGAVAPTVVLVPAAAEAMVGTRLEPQALARLAAACERACNPIDDKRGTVEFRNDVAGVLARRAAGLGYQRAGER